MPPELLHRSRPGAIRAAPGIRRAASGGHEKAESARRRAAPGISVRKLPYRRKNAQIMNRFSTLIENSKRAVRYWWLLLIVGIVLLAAGILTFVYPAQSYLSMAVLFGWLMLFAGVMEVVLSSTSRHFVTGRGWMLAGGIIEIVLGIILIFNVALSASVLPVVLGFWLLMRGFSAIGLGGDLNALSVPGSGWTIFSGILLVFCSLWILFQPLVFGTAAVVAWVGISLLFAGIAACSLSMQLHRAHRCLDKGDCPPAAAV